MEDQVEQEYLPHGRQNIWDGCSTAIRHVARKMATIEGRLVCFRDDFTAEM